LVGKHLKNRILIAQVILIFFISIVFISMMRLQQKDVLTTLIENEQEVAKNIYEYTLKTLYDKYLFIADNLLLNEGIIKAVADQDHQKLLILTKNYYKKFKIDNPYLDVMHFHTPETKSLLRLHKPDKYGDDLNELRPIIAQTNITKKIQLGLEVGKYGVDYRVAVPIFYHGKHIGVLEFGINAEYVVNILSKHYELESILLLNEKKLSTLYANTKKVERTNIKDFIIASSTFLPDDTVKSIDNLTTGTTQQLTYFDVEHIVFKATDMINYKKEPIGQVHLLKNIDFFTSSASHSVMMISLSTVLLIIISFVLSRYGFNVFIRVIDNAQKELVQKKNTLEELINIDHLTKALNRRRIDEILQSECKRTKRYNEPLSAIILDIDNFKNVNDNYGHNIGDKVLKRLAKIVTDSIRGTDYFGRWGGEEFIIVTTSTDLEDASKLAQKIQEIIASTDFEELDQVTCSFGVAQYSEGDTVEYLIHKADEALYQAKERGKNCVVEWEAQAPTA